METKIVAGTPAATGVGEKGTELLVTPQFQGAHVTFKPQDYIQKGQLLGHYRVAVPTGLVTGVAAAGALLSMRWSDSKAYCLLKRLAVGAVIMTAYTTAQALDVDAVVQRAFTIADTGGTAVSLTGNNQKNRASMGASLAADMRVAAAAALGAGTKTADAQAFGLASLPNTNAIGTGSPPVDLYKYDVMNQHPVMFAKDEGFNARIVTAQGVVGVVKYYFIVEWAEVLGI